jgi:nucleotide-binding universal stress UspA family protein
MDHVRAIGEGYDGTEGSVAAVAWAAAAAQDRVVRLRLVAAARTTMMPWPVGITAPVLMEAEPVAKALADEGVDLAATVLPREQVVAVAATENPVDRLVEESASAGLVVVGTRGHGPVRSAILGSVSSAVATHAQSPVVVVRPPAKANQVPTRVVVAGMHDASSDAAVDFAATEAVRLGALLRLVCVWTTVEQAGWEFAAWQPDDIREWRDSRASAAAQLVESAAARLAERHPHLVVVTHTPPGRPGPALVAAADDADLVVLGGAPRPVDGPAFLGPVAHHLLHHAACSVAVVPSTQPVPTA